MTKARDKHFSRIVDLGCIICQSPAEIHHCFTSMGCKKNDNAVIGLCPRHHRTGGYGIAIHAGKRNWQERYGSEAELFDKTIELLNE